jgi:hypothetical protein
MLLSKDKIHIIPPGREQDFNEGIHVAACFVIDDIVVENGMYSREFFDLFNNSSIEEKEEYENEEIRIALTENNSAEKQYMILNERLASIMLSNPQLIEVPESMRWVTIGSQYIDGVFYP